MPLFQLGRFLAILKRRDVAALALAVCPLGCFSIPVVALTATDLGLDTRVGNYSPLVQIYGLPQLSLQTPTQASKGLTAGSSPKQVFAANLTLTSVSHQSSTASESVLLDGEILSLGIHYQRELPFADWLGSFLHLNKPTIGLYAPYIHHGSGFMDAGIAKWHDWLGLPNGNRDRRPNNVLRYRFIRNNTELVSIAKEQHGFGDIQLQLSASTTPSCTSTPQMHFAVGVKLPTGSQAKLTGSDGTDSYLTAAIDNPIDLRRWAIHSHVNLSYLHVEPSGRLAEITKKDVLSGQLQIRRPIAVNWQASISFNYNEAIHRSNLEAVGEDALTGGFFVTRSFSKHALSIGIIEDIFTDNSQDFSLRIGWRASTE